MAKKTGHQDKVEPVTNCDRLPNNKVKENQTKNNLHKFFYWLHLVYNTGYHQPMRWLRAMLLRLEQWRLMMPCASAAPRCGACRAGVTAPDAVRG